MSVETGIALTYVVLTGLNMWLTSKRLELVEKALKLLAEELCDNRTGTGSTSEESGTSGK